MPNDQTPSIPRKESRLTQWVRRLENRKVGVGTVIVFIGMLGVICLMAAGVGMLTHHLRTH